MSHYLLTCISLSVLVIAYCLFVGLYDRQYKNMKKKRSWLINIILISLGIFASFITSTYYLEGVSIKYLIPILIYSVATLAVITYTCLLNKIYQIKDKCKKNDSEKIEK